MRILIVDDDPAMKRRIMAILRDGKHEYRHVATGKTCLQTINIWIPDVVLIDYPMPKCDTLWICGAIEHINHERKTHRIYTIVLIESEPTDFIKNCMRSAGSINLIDKPELTEKDEAKWVDFSNQIQVHIGFFKSEIDFRNQLLSDETGLASKKQILEHLVEALKNSAVSLMYIDIDGFKKFNDTYGHLVGDHILRQIANRLRSSVKKNTYLGRLQGDEFVVVLETGDKEVVMMRAEQLLHITDQSFSLPESGHVHLTLSIGVAIIKANTPLSDALDLADKAMYRAKGAGRNQICLEDSS